LELRGVNKHEAVSDSEPLDRQKRKIREEQRAKKYLPHY
jgi:hypothetical protein